MKMEKLNIFNHSTSVYISIGVAILLLAQMLIDLFYTGLLNIDEIEHIHASWLVWSGKIPYMDFFEHHNPLLWYLFAPFTGLMFDNINIYFVCRLAALAANLASWWFIYKIIRQWLGTYKIWLSALVMFCCGDYVSRNFVEFRPDVFMNLCFWSGLYFYLAYFANKRLIYLQAAFVLFCLAFFFLQKIILLLLVLGVFTIYQLVKKQIKFIDILKALIAPAIITLIFVLWLTYHKMLGLYWELNYSLNSLLPQYYGLHMVKFIIFGVMLHLPFYNGWASIFFSPAAVVLSFAAILCYSKIWQKNIAAKCLIILFFAELFIRIFTFSPYAHYFSLLETFASVIIAGAMFDKEKTFKNYLYNSAMFLVFIITCSFVICSYTQRDNNAKIKPFLEKAQFVIDQTKPTEAVLNSNNDNFNIFRPDAHYVWFLLNDIGYIYEMNFLQKTNLDDLVKAKKSVLIKPSNYSNTPLSERRNKKLFEYNTDIMRLHQKQNISDVNVLDLLIKIPQPEAYKWNMELVEKYYRPTEYGFWILKDEYRKQEN